MARAARELDEKQYDYLVYGTGLTESILAAALAHAGASVLHLDSNDFYGASSATFSLHALQKKIDENSRQEPVSNESDSTRGKNEDVPRDAVLRSVPKPMLFPNGFRLLTPSHSMPDSRRIFVDMAPRLLMSSGPMVDMMVGTKVGHYLDFRALEGIYLAFTDTNTNIEEDTDTDTGTGGWSWKRVPASRSDVFKDRFVTMLEKRLLMRYVKSASAALLLGKEGIENDPVEEDTDTDIGTGSFEDHMKAAGLTDKLQAMLVHGIVLGDKAAASQMGVSEAKERILTFQKSLLRFPNTKTPFLYPNYGTAEIAQAFCRACAVQGGTYLLRRSISDIASTQEGELIGCTTDNNEFVRCKAVFAPASIYKDMDMDMDMEKGNDAEGSVWRCVCVLDACLIGDVKRALFVVPKDSLGNSTADVRIIQLDSDTNTCPKGSYLLYAQTVGITGTENDLVSALKHFVQFEYNDNDSEESGDTYGKEKEETRMPGVRWGIIYSIDISAQPGIESIIIPSIPSIPRGVRGVHLLKEGGAEGDAEFCVKTAKIAFESVLPDAEFFGEKKEEEIVTVDESALEDGAEDASNVGETTSTDTAKVVGAVKSPHGDDDDDIGKAAGDIENSNGVDIENKN